MLFELSRMQRISKREYATGSWGNKEEVQRRVMTGDDDLGVFFSL